MNDPRGSSVGGIPKFLFLVQISQDIDSFRQKKSQGFQS